MNSVNLDVVKKEKVKDARNIGVISDIYAGSTIDREVIEPAMVEKKAIYITLISAAVISSGMQRASEALVKPSKNVEIIYVFSQF